MRPPVCPSTRQWRRTQSTQVSYTVTSESRSGSRSRNFSSPSTVSIPVADLQPLGRVLEVGTELVLRRDAFEVALERGCEQQLFPSRLNVSAIQDALAVLRQHDAKAVRQILAVQCRKSKPTKRGLHAQELASSAVEIPPRPGDGWLSRTDPRGG